MNTRIAALFTVLALTVLWGSGYAFAADAPTPFDHGDCCMLVDDSESLPSLRISVNVFGIHVDGEGFQPSTSLTVRFDYEPVSHENGRAGSQTGHYTDEAGQFTTTLPLRLITERPGLFSVSIDGTTAKGELWILF